MRCFFSDEILTLPERCVHHATLLGPTFSKTVSSPRLLKRIAGIFAAWTTNGWWWWFAKPRVEEKLQHRLVIVPKLHFCSCVGIKTLISMTSCFFTPATSENMHEILKRARWTTTEGIHRLYTATAPSRLNLFFKLRSCMLMQTRKRLKWQQAYGKRQVVVPINGSLNGAISASRMDQNSYDPQTRFLSSTRICAFR